MKGATSEQAVAAIRASAELAPDLDAQDREAAIAESLRLQQQGVGAREGLAAAMQRADRAGLGLKEYREQVVGMQTALGSDERTALAFRQLGGEKGAAGDLAKALSGAAPGANFQERLAAAQGDEGIRKQVTAALFGKRPGEVERSLKSGKFTPTDQQQAALDALAGNARYQQALAAQQTAAPGADLEAVLAEQGRQQATRPGQLVEMDRVKRQALTAGKLLSDEALEGKARETAQALRTQFNPQRYGGGPIGSTLNFLRTTAEDLQGIFQPDRAGFARERVSGAIDAATGATEKRAVTKTMAGAPIEAEASMVKALAQLGAKFDKLIELQTNGKPIDVNVKSLPATNHQPQPPGTASLKD